MSESELKMQHYGNQKRNLNSGIYYTLFSVLKIDNSQVAHHACVIIVVIIVVFVFIFLSTWHHISVVSI